VYDPDLFLGEAECLIRFNTCLSLKQVEQQLSNLNTILSSLSLQTPRSRSTYGLSWQLKGKGVDDWVKVVDQEGKLINHLAY
jgi:hypothetical protein